ncbi:MAG: hypothetical protein WCY26_01190 [Thiohalobacteraceae bacterium]|nr:hypothetical protein [Gammaproteobacteria bacterium]
MADLFSMTVPLLIRTPAGTRHIMIEYFPLVEESGLVYFEPYWHLQRPASQAIHRIVGEVRGDGPWKVGDHVVTVLGCHGTDPQLANTFSDWQSYLQTGAPGYPERGAILALAAARGARIV